MNAQLHPIFQQALAPFAAPAPVLKAAAGNKNLSPIVLAKVMRHGPNDYFKSLAEPVVLERAKRDLATLMETLIKAGQSVLTLFTGQ